MDAEADRLAEEQAALLRVTSLVARGAPSAEIFDAVTREATLLIDDEPTTLVRFTGDRTFIVLATDHGPAPVGTSFTVPPQDAGTLDEMMRTMRPARRDRYDVVADRSFSNNEFGVGSSVSIPVVVDGRLWGALGTLTQGRRLPANTEERLVKFAALISTALANVEARNQLEQVGLEQAALRRVAELAASGVEYQEVLRTVVAEAATLLRAFVSVERSGPGQSREVIASGGDPVAPTQGASVEARVTVDGLSWGMLVARTGARSLPPRAQETLMQFAQIAGIAVAGDQARRALQDLAAEQAALRRVAEMVARGTPLDEVFEAVAAEASSILSGRSAHLVQFDDGSATVVATCNSPVPLGLRTPTDDGTINATLLRTRQAVRVPILTGAAARLAEGLGVNTLVIVPVIAEGRVWGALATTGDQPLPANTEHRLTEFAEIAAAAIANAENKAALLASRARIVATANETRQQMQRDVHDGVQQRLVQTVLTLHLALEASAKGAETADLVREALQTAERATDELRDLVQGILPASLTRGGLRAGLESLLAGLALPVSLDMAAKPLERMAPNVEVTAYFVVAEGLTNAVKHARAQHARVSVAADDDALIVEVADDGVGGADPGRGSGLTGLMDRVDAMRGTLTLTSAAGSGTTIRVTLPLRG